MTSVLSLASLGSQSSPSFSPSASASSSIPSALHPTLSLVEGTGEISRADVLSELAAAVFELENLIRSTYAASARVTTAFASATAAEGLSPLVGHQFLAQVSRVSLHLSDALGHSADGHRILRKLGTQLGYDVTAYGDTNCPPEYAHSGLQTDLSRDAA